MNLINQCIEFYKITIVSLVLGCEGEKVLWTAGGNGSPFYLFNIINFTNLALNKNFSHRHKKHGC
jgi:hypothetical protein